MFTSRAEYRLKLRADNADRRLTELGSEIGCISKIRLDLFLEKKRHIDTLRDLLDNAYFSPSELKQQGFEVSQDGIKRIAAEWCRFPKIHLNDFSKTIPSIAGFSSEVIEQVQIDLEYAAYYKRQAEEIELMKKQEQFKLPEDLDYDQIKALSNELRLKLKNSSPGSIADAKKIEGMTPAAIASLYRFCAS